MLFAWILVSSLLSEESLLRCSCHVEELNFDSGFSVFTVRTMLTNTVHACLGDAETYELARILALLLDDRLHLSMFLPATLNLLNLISR